MAFKVLLADDSAPAKNLGKKILEEAGYEVVVCSNGLEASRKIAETAPDLAIFDIFMPGYTGLELCGKLRENPATAQLPVILMVGKVEPYRPEEGEQVRADAVVFKPFSEDELISAVRKLIGSPYGSRKAFAQPGAAASTPKVAKPLIEWWDPATEAIERSIAAARQRRQGVVPAAGEGEPGKMGPSGSNESASFSQEPTSEQDDEGDPGSLADEPEENFALDVPEEAVDEFIGVAGVPQEGESSTVESVVQEIFEPEAPAADFATAIEDEQVWPEGNEAMQSEVDESLLSERLAEATAQATAIIATAMSVAQETAQKSTPGPVDNSATESATGFSPEPPIVSEDSSAPDVATESAVELQPAPAVRVTTIAGEPPHSELSEADRIRQAVEAVVERFRPQIVEAVQRELNRD